MEQVEEIDVFEMGEEIKAGIWDCDSFKCPGSDGVNLGFFKDFSDVLKIDLLNFFAEFHRNGKLTKGLNSTFIALIPKVESPQRVADFRPISLVSSVYKILSKVLANRLRKVVGKVVSDSQSAFIKGRQILDGILIANELVDDAKVKKKDLLLFKVDFEKAYDFVDWGYIDEVMCKMNFLSVWRSWIMECITTATTSVLVNGCPTDEFTLERGLRQGDPLSPFLFLLAAEGLNVMMTALVTNGMFTPYGVGAQDNVLVSHLQFADDTLLVGVKSWANVRAMRAVLLLFESISGLKVNFHKSMLFGVNVNNSWLHEAAVVMNCKHGRIPFLYLGLPIGGDPRKLQFWQPLVERIRSRLSGVLEDRESLWNVVLRAKYGEVGGRVRFCEGVGSVWWRHINQIRSGVGLVDPRWLLDNIVRKVGDGCHTLFWEDPWLEDVPLAVSFSRLYELSNFKLATVREMSLLGWGLDGGAWRWRRRLFAWEEGLLGECVGRLVNSVLQVDVSDRWEWKLLPTKSYSVQSAYSYLTAVDTNISEDFDQFLWLKAVPLKVNIFVWRLFMNRLATKDNLCKRNVIASSLLACVTSCGKEEERDHLFFLCDHYGRLWLLISQWLGFVTTLNGNLHSHASQFCALGGFSKKSVTGFTIIWISVLFVIWKDRNRRIFQQQFDQLEVLLERVKLQTFWWLKANYILFDFDYPYWRKNPFLCLQTAL
ncbi:uncharacterized protein [Medicago truncatula]|uniref:uncharacterized protein n=1 Tax=Medicago truncatula TaxID=3880 RepID=UPI000D2F35B2|nr:uncharacterized protein LOC112420077 [Medicago truncatula]